MLQKLAPLARTLCLGSCLAAITSCGKRVDPAARESGLATPSTHVEASPPPQTDLRTPPPLVDPSMPIRLTATELSALVSHAQRAGTLINVWATWCGPCREELPLLAKIHRTYAPKGLAVIPLSVDEPAEEGKVAALLKGYGFAGPYYVAARPLEELKRSLSESWPGNVPVSFLLDSNARRRFFFTAQVYEHELTPKLDLFLQGKLESGTANFAIAPGKTL